MSRFHEALKRAQPPPRMPVVLEESRLDEWMDSKAPNAPLRAMLRLAPVL